MDLGLEFVLFLGAGFALLYTALCLVPWAIASLRGVPGAAWVFWLGIFIAWSVIGWIGLLVYAFLAPGRVTRPAGG